MEIELKLSLAPQDAAALRRHPLLAGGTPVRKQLHSTYLDTPAWDLLRRRVALRVRKAGRQWLQTLKAEAASVGALTSRPEWECELPRGHHDLGRLPPEALRHLDGIDTRLIGPAFTTAFRRTAWLVERDGASMEVALDEGEVRAGADALPLCELEIELKSGPPLVLFDLALALLADLPMGVEPRSKAMRGYALAGAVRPAPVKAVAPDLRGCTDAGQAWRALAEAALAQMVGNVPGFLQTPEENEYLHQLRVGARRLSAVAGLAPTLGMPEPAWTDGLKALMDGLNAARDWDVFLAEVLPRVESALADAPLGAPTRRQLARAAARARGGAQAAVAGFTALVLAIGRDLAGEPPAGGAVADWAAECLEARWRRLCKRGKDFQHQDALRRHRLRIAAKRMRYTADALAGLFDRPDKFLGRLAALQDRLGAGQDAVMAGRLMTGLGTRSPQVLFDAGRIAGVLAAGMPAHGSSGGKAWRALLAARPFWPRAAQAEGRQT